MLKEYPAADSNADSQGKEEGKAAEAAASAAVIDQCHQFQKQHQQKLLTMFVALIAYKTPFDDIEGTIKPMLIEYKRRRRQQQQPEAENNSAEIDKSLDSNPNLITFGELYDALLECGKFTKDQLDSNLSELLVSLFSITSNRYWFHLTLQLLLSLFVRLPRLCVTHK